MKSSDPSLYLTHILESIEFAQSYVAGIDYIGFSENQQLQDAVVRRKFVPYLSGSGPTRALPNEGVNLTARYARRS